MFSYIMAHSNQMVEGQCALVCGRLAEFVLAQLSGAHDALGEQRRKAVELLAPPPSQHGDCPRQFVRIAVADFGWRRDADIQSG